MASRRACAVVRPSFGCLYVCFTSCAPVVHPPKGHDGGSGDRKVKTSSEAATQRCPTRGVPKEEDYQALGGEKLRFFREGCQKRSLDDS
jgi:hypothetical protein